MKKILRMGWVLVALSLLSGCIDYSEEIWINADGSGRIKVDVGLSPLIAGMVMKEGGDQSFCSQSDSVETSDPNIIRQQTRMHSEGEMIHCIMEAQVKDFRKIAEMDTMPMEEGGAKLESLFVIEDLGGGVARFHRRMVSKQEKKNEESASSRRDAELDEMMAEMFAERYLSITLHAPAVLSNSGGTLNPERTTVNWTVPFYEFSANDQVLDARAEVRYASTPGGR